MIDPRAEYDRRLSTWAERLARFGRIHLLISNLRLVVAVVGAVMVWLWLARSAVAPLWLLLPGAAFGALVVVHVRVLSSSERARRGCHWYARGLNRLRGQWAGTGRDGARFADSHPYARDLDLFGPGSLFELINTTVTDAGEATLADWLKTSAELQDIRARQQSVDELRSMVDFREELAMLATEAHVGRTGVLATWAASPQPGLGAAAAVLFAGCALVALALGLVAALGYGAEPLLVWLVVEYGVVFFAERRVAGALAVIDAAERDLELLAAVLARIERETFSSGRLTALRAVLQTDGAPPSKRVAELRRLIGILDSTRNQLLAPIAYPLLVRSQVAVAVNRWRRLYGPAVDRWVRVAGEVEALAALGAYAFEQPADPLPSLVEEGPLFEADGLAHPLVPRGSAVANDVRLGGDGPRVVIVSGSNMSGKSTLLRSVGINVVLAMAGAPVRARGLAVSRLVLGATIRIEDSLQEGRSRFYSEILRIRTIVDAARGPTPLLFLLDEVLHGTNSYDRRVGAQGIVQALVTLGAVGLVTTHDLALTELPAAMGGRAVNVHFADRLEGGKLVFDYKMRPGVVEHSNALALMRAIGLDV